jgi:translation initiation factor IF-3
MVIDEDGTQLGEMETSEALKLAKSKELDLVEVAPNARPPVCKILDYGQLKYQKAKEEQKQRKKQKKVEVKGVRISIRISENDLNFKVNQAQKFLDKGNKVRVEIIMRGREKAHMNLGRDMLMKFADKLEGNIIMEQKPKRERLGLAIVLAKK